MAIPSEAEKIKLSKKIEGFKKKLLEDGRPKRKIDDNAVKQLFRSAVRKEWMKCPTKLAFLLSSRIPNDNPKGNLKWLHRCNKCKGIFKEGDVQVDHIQGENEFTDWTKAHSYGSSILDVAFSQLQILCKECHSTKTRCEQLDLDWRTKEGWERGKLEQEFTRIVDSKAEGQKKYISNKGLSPESNEEKRKIQIRTLLNIL